MKINERYLKKLVRESLSRLLLERKSDKYYDILNEVLLECMTDPNNLISLGWYSSGGTGAHSFEVSLARGSLRVPDVGRTINNVDFGHPGSGMQKYFKIANKVRDYYAFGYLLYNDPTMEKLKKAFEKTGNSINNRYCYIYAVNAQSINAFSKKAHSLINDDDFLDLNSLEMLFQQLLIKIHPTLRPAGGSMTNDGEFSVSFDYLTVNDYAGLKKLGINTADLLSSISDNEPPPLDSTPPTSEELIAAAVNNPNYLHTHGAKPLSPELRKNIIKHRTKKFTPPSEEELKIIIAALNFANLEKEDFDKFLSSNGVSATTIYHEGTHLINGMRARYKSGHTRDVDNRDSGLENLFDKEQKENPEKFGPGKTMIGSKTYTLSTEELSARYVELRYAIKKCLELAYDLAFKSPFSPNISTLTPEQKRDKFLKQLMSMKTTPWPETGKGLAPTVAYLISNLKSEAVNNLLRNRAEEDVVNPFTGEKIELNKDNYGSWLSNDIFATYGPKGTWETKKGKERIGRVYNRVVELVEYIEDWIDKNL